MSEELDPRMEALMREAAGREDVYRFRQVLRDVAAEVEAREGRERGRVIPIGRKTGWVWMAAAASAALVATIAIAQWLRPDHEQLAYQASMPHTRGDDALTYYSGESLLDSAMYQVRTRHPEAAIMLLKGYAVKDPQRDCQRDWVKALALLMQEKTDEAEVLLKSVVGSTCSSESGYAEDLLKEI